MKSQAEGGKAKRSIQETSPATGGYFGHLARKLPALLIATPVLAFAFFAAMSATGYAWLDWKTYTVVTPVHVYDDIVDVPSPALVDKKPIAVLASGTKCKLVQQYGKDINVSSRMRCENGVDGWVNESIAFDPVPPGPR